MPVFSSTLLESEKKSHPIGQLPSQEPRKSIGLGIAHLLDLQHLLSGKSLVLAVLNGRWLLEVLAHLELADDAFLLDHSLEALYSFLQRFGLIDFNKCHILTHPLCPSAQESTKHTIQAQICLVIDDN